LYLSGLKKRAVLEMIIDGIPNSIRRSDDNYNGPTRKIDAKVHLIRSEEDFLQLRKNWNTLAQISGSSIFQTFEWNYIWWKHFGKGKELHILTLKNGTDLLGILPLFVDTISVFGRPVYRCLRFLGSTVSQPSGTDLKGLMAYTDYMDAIVYPGFEEFFSREIIHFLLHKCEVSYHEVILEEVSEESVCRNHFIPRLQEMDVGFTVTEASVCPQVKLEPCWEAYLQPLSKSRRSKIRRFLKLACKNSNNKHLFTIERIKDVKPMVASLDKLVHMHQQRWNEMGFPGSFAENRYYEFVKEILSTLGNRGLAVVYLAKNADDPTQVVAADLLLTYQQRTYLLLRGINVYADHLDRGPGNVLLYSEIQDAVAAKHEVFDFLRGAENYKLRTANQQVQNKTIGFTHPNKKHHLLDRCIRFLIVLRRRLKVEVEEFQILRNQHKFPELVVSYYHFLAHRVAKKFKKSDSEPQ